MPRRRPPPPAAAARLPARPTRPSRPPVRPLARPTAHPPPPPPENFCACRIYFWRIYCCCERTAATGHRRSPGTTGPAHHKNHGDRMTTPLSPPPLPPLPHLPFSLYDESIFLDTVLCPFPASERGQRARASGWTHAQRNSGGNARGGTMGGDLGWNHGAEPGQAGRSRGGPFLPFILLFS